VRDTSVTAGTIFAGTRTPLTSWFAAVWYVVNQKQGVSALGLQRVLGLASYETAWAWLHKLRRAMVRPDREGLNGAVEVDETIIGGVRPGCRGRGAPGKALVAIAVEARAGGPGRVRMQRIPNASKDVLTDFVLDHIERRAEVRTDGWFGYNGLGEHRFSHVVTNVKISATPPMSRCPRSTASRACSSAGCWAPTRAPSATTSSTTTSTSSPSASTAAARDTADCSSTACSSKPSRPIPTR
jgi:hypothetical protein